MKLLDWIKQELAKKNVSVSEQDIKDGKDIDVPEGTPPGVPPVTIPAGGHGNAADIEAIVNKAIAPFIKQNTDLQQLLADEKKAREDANTALQNKFKTEQTAKIDTVIAEMKKDGRLGPENKEMEARHRKLLEYDFDSHKAIVDNMPKDPNLTKDGKDGKEKKDGNNGNQQITGNSKPSSALGTSVKPGIMQYVNENITNN